MVHGLVVHGTTLFSLFIMRHQSKLLLLHSLSLQVVRVCQLLGALFYVLLLFTCLSRVSRLVEGIPFVYLLLFLFAVSHNNKPAANVNWGTDRAILDRLFLGTSDICWGHKKAN